MASSRLRLTLRCPVSFLCSSWTDIRVKGTTLPAALHCWEQRLQGNALPVADCPQHVIESCLWPQCNPTCPQLFDQITGQKISIVCFLEDMEDEVARMAKFLGMVARDEG